MTKIVWLLRLERTVDLRLRASSNVPHRLSSSWLTIGEMCMTILMSEVLPIDRWLRILYAVRSDLDGWTLTVDGRDELWQRLTLDCMPLWSDIDRALDTSALSWRFAVPDLNLYRVVDVLLLCVGNG